MDEIPKDISDIIFKGGVRHPATWIQYKTHLKTWIPTTAFSKSSSVRHYQFRSK